MEKKTKEYRLREVRALENEEKMIVEGYAAVFDEPTDFGYYIEVIQRGALDNCDMSDVCMKYNHEDTVLVMARTRNNSLQLSIDDHGLKVYAELLDTTSNRDIFKAIKAGLLDKMSFAFTIEEAVWEWFEGEENKKEIRTITKIDKMFDVSVVDFPAYDQTEIYARNKEVIEKEIDEFHRLELAKEKLKLKLSL